jgi:hypothetical protein
VREASRAVTSFDALLTEWNETDLRSRSADEISKLNAHQVEAARMTAEELVLRAKDVARTLRVLNANREDA